MDNFINKELVALSSSEDKPEDKLEEKSEPKTEEKESLVEDFEEIIEKQIGSHPLISLKYMDLKQTPIYDIDDIELNKIRVSRPIKMGKIIKIFLLYPSIDNKIYTRFFLETYFNTCHFGLDAKRSDYNKRVTYWMKVEYFKFADIDSEDFKSFRFYQYISKYLEIKMEKIYDNIDEEDSYGTEYMSFVCNTSGNKIDTIPVTRFMLDHKKEFETECMDKTGRHVSPYDIPLKCNIKFLLKPINIWRNDQYHGGTWVVKKMMIDDVV